MGGLEIFPSALTKAQHLLLELERLNFEDRLKDDDIKPQETVAIWLKIELIRLEQKGLEEKFPISNDYKL